jgi:glycosyltransferase 2 family protein
LRPRLTLSGGEVKAGAPAAGWTALAASPALRVAVAAVLLALVLTVADIRAVWARISALDPAIALLMVCVNAVLFVLFAARWRAVARTLGIDAPYARFLGGTWIAALVSQLGPALVLNEITRFRVLRPHASAWPLAASQVLDRLSGQIVLLALILLAAPYYFTVFSNELGARILLAAGLLVMLGALFIALAHRLRRLIRLDPRSLRVVLHPFTSPAHYGCSLAIQLLLVANLGLAVAGVSTDAPPHGLYLVAPLVLAGLTLVPLSPGDWGSREAAALLFFSATGLAPDTIVAASILYGGVNLVCALPAGLLLLRVGDSAGGVSGGSS